MRKFFIWFCPWGPPRVKVGGGQRKLEWASDWNVTKLHCINKVTCQKCSFNYDNALLLENGEKVTIFSN